MALGLMEMKALDCVLFLLGTTQAIPGTHGSPFLLLSSVVRGSESHKMIDLSGNPILRIYYTSRVSTLCPALFAQFRARSG